MNTQVLLKHIQVSDLEFKTTNFSKNITDNLDISFSIFTTNNNIQSKEFEIVFVVGLESENKDFILKLTTTAYFETKEEITDLFLKSSFVKVSAPAIAFPYIRTFISK